MCGFYWAALCIYVHVCVRVCLACVSVFLFYADIIEIFR